MLWPNITKVVEDALPRYWMFQFAVIYNRENEKLPENENVRLEFSSKKFEARKLLNSNASVPENGCCFSNSYFDKKLINKTLFIL